MRLVKDFKELGQADVATAGGKGASLGEMTRAGIPVPPGFVILANAFEQFLAETDLNVEIDAALETVKSSEMHTVEHASEKIQALILGAKMPADIKAAVQEFYAKLDAPYVAVRSSATAEDSASAAWAGQLDSYLNTTSETLLTNVQRCWASLFTPRAIFYRFEKELNTKKISVAVVVQKMVESEVSGIAFSVHPVTEDHNQLIIEAGYGLGEAIVSGSVTPNSYVIEKEPRRIIDVNVSTQSRALYRIDGGGNEWRDIPEPKASSQILTEAQILELSEVIVSIENHYDFPCDIEWAYEAGKFYIVQSRPITTLSNAQHTVEVTPVVTDYEKTFESKGTSLLFEDLVEDFYNPGGTVSICQNGTKTVYTSHHREEAMSQEGLQMSVKVLQDKAQSIDRLIKQLTVEAGEFRTKNDFSRDDVAYMIEQLASFAREYYYFDISVWNSVFSKSQKGDSLATEKVRIVEESKNKIREDVDPIFFAADGYFFTLIAKMAETTGTSVNDLERYRVRELAPLFDGTLVPAAELTRRAHAYAYYKEESGVQHFFSGEATDAFAKTFCAASDATQTTRDHVVGKVAHRGGGKVVGRARLLMRDYGSKEGFQKTMETVKAGSIIVAPTTDPEMMPALRKAGAIVTDIGGLLSHSAIVARELDIPCIIATQNATRVLHDGDLVEVDADNGVVRIIERA